MGKRAACPKTRCRGFLIYGFALTKILIGATLVESQVPITAIGSSLLNCEANLPATIPSACNADINASAALVTPASELKCVPMSTPDMFGPEIALPMRLTVQPPCCIAPFMRPVIPAISWASPIMITSTRLGPIGRNLAAIRVCWVGLKDRGALNLASSRLASAARASACLADSFALPISRRKPSAFALASAEARCASATLDTASFEAAFADAIAASAVFTRASDSVILLSNCLAVAVASAAPRCASAILTSCALATVSFNSSFRLPAIMTKAVKRNPNSRLAAIPQLARVIASESRSTDSHKSWKKVMVFGMLREDYFLLISGFAIVAVAFVLGCSINRNK